MSPQARSWLGHCWLSFIRKPLRALPREHLPSTNVCRINELSKKFTGVHRIWPKDRPDSKPSLDAVMSQTQIEKKVKDYLRNSQALRITGNDRLQLSSYRPRWIAWQSTPNSQKFCANSLKRWAMILL
jgi:hypothetical protein